jgi:putative oxidoreductase
MEQMIAKLQPYALSLMRFVIGLVLFAYGVAKIFKYPPVDYLANLPPLLITSGWIEFVIGGLLMIGLFTRLTAFILSGEMASAYFLGHVFKNPEPVWNPILNEGTPAIVLCFACLYLATAGGGPLSVDAAMGKTARR